MLRLQIAASAEHTQAALDALRVTSGLTVDRDDVLLTCLQPGQPTAHEPAGLRPIAVPLWIATQAGALICTPRETQELDRLFADLATFEAANLWRNLSVLPEGLTPPARLTVEQGSTPLEQGAALQVGKRYDFRVHNDANAARYLTLIEIGSDQQVRQLVPHPLHVHSTAPRIEAGQSLAVATDYYAQDPQFAAAVADGLLAQLPGGHPWTPEATAGMQLMAILSLTPLSLQIDDPPPAVVSGDLATLALTIEGEPPAPADEADDGEREISPTGSGYVLIYWVELLDGTKLGHLGVTSTTGMQHLKANQGYWNWFPKKEDPWPAEFQLRGETNGQHETKVLTQFAGSKRLTNPTFDTEAKPISAPAGVTQAWKVTQGSNLLGYMARADETLYWYSIQKRDYLPLGTLLFSQTSLPTSGDFFAAVDVPLN